MTREIKFIVWGIEQKRMQPYALIYTARGGEPETLDDAIDIAEHRYKLLQYTGLKDRNGVEIYEGYIVKKSYPKSKPQRRSIVFAIEYKELFDNEMGYSLGIGFDFHGYGSHKLEVIGNIYENPELLK